MVDLLDITSRSIGVFVLVGCCVDYKTGGGGEIFMIMLINIGIP